MYLPVVIRGMWSAGRLPAAMRLSTPLKVISASAMGEPFSFTSPEARSTAEESDPDDEYVTYTSTSEQSSRGKVGRVGSVGSWMRVPALYSACCVLYVVRLASYASSSARRHATPS